MEVVVKKVRGFRVKKDLLDMVKRGGKGEERRVNNLVECVLMDGMY